MASTKGGLGKLLGFGKKKKLKSVHSGSIAASEEDSDSDDGYQDPAETCSTEPPIIRAPAPSYPPPRPVSLLPGSNPTISQTAPHRDDYQDPWDSKHGKPPGPAIAANDKSEPIISAYQDPYDAKVAHNHYDSHPKAVKLSSSEELFKEKPAVKGPLANQSPIVVNDDDDDRYDEPYEAKSSIAPHDTYADPWDAKRSYSESVKPTRTAISSADSVTAGLTVPSKFKDEYTDPWDSKTSSSLSKSYEEDETYSEPYDQGKSTMFDKVSVRKKRDEKDEGVDADELYDLPYEEQTLIGIIPTAEKVEKKPHGADYDAPWEWSIKDQGKNSLSLPASVRKEPPKLSNQLSKPSPQPRPHPRPQPVKPPLQPKPSGLEKPPSIELLSSDKDVSANYDSPWEWGHKTVEQELEKRFSTSDLSSPAAPESSAPVSPSTKSSQFRVSDAALSNAKMPSATNVNPVQKAARSPDVKVPPSGSPKAYQVDPTIPLENQGWFHGSLKRSEAENLLRHMPDCSYLIRNSESSMIDYSLSLKNNKETMHLKIACRDGKYILGVNSKPYDSIPEMIHHYSMNKLNIRFAEHVKLVYPVLQQPTYFTLEAGS